MISIRSFPLGVFHFSFVLFLTSVASVHCLAQSDEQDNRSQLNRTEKYVSELLSKYDKDNDGFLDDAEMNVMRQRPTSNIDRNGDGKLSKEELFFQYSGGRSLTGGSPNQEMLSTIELEVRLFRLDREIQLPQEKDRWAEALSKTATSLSMQATLICGRESVFQVGQMLPRVVGQSVNRQQGTSRQINMVDVGSILKLTPLKNEENYVLNLQLEHSGVEPTDDPLVQPVERLQVNQSMRLSNGGATSVIQHNGVRWVVLVNARE